MSEIFNIIVSLATLTILEVILGIDNLVFLAIITGRLPKETRALAQKLGLTLAWVTRLILLASALYITKLTKPLFIILGTSFSGRDIFLILGGLFLLTKSTQEIHNEIEPKQKTVKKIKKYARFGIVITQIAILDIIFSLDSILTAIGLTQNYILMVIAITIAIIAMIFSSNPITQFIEKHPSIKMLALSFLLLIGVILIADGFEFHVPRGYIYFSMTFALFVEFLNLVRQKRQ